MAASDNLNGQLRMFMTARELHDTDSIDVMQAPDSRYGGAWAAKSDMWERKKLENRQGGFDKLIAAQGVHKPVELTSGTDVEGSVIRDGHHRIQAAFDASPESYLPVEHHDLDKGPLGRGVR